MGGLSFARSAGCPHPANDKSRLEQRDNAYSFAGRGRPALRADTAANGASVLGATVP